MEILKDLVGWGMEGKELNCYQMSVRAVIVFFVTLTYIRISGMRTIGKNTAIDIIIGLILGSVMSRIINGSAPLGPTLVASLVLVMMHRVIALITYRSHWLGRIMKGEPMLLVRNGEILWENMRKNNISENDLMEGIRRNGNINDLSQVEEAYFERTGAITVVKKPAAAGR